MGVTIFSFAATQPKLAADAIKPEKTDDLWTRSEKTLLDESFATMNLRDSQETLWNAFLKGEKDWEEMVSEARMRERRRRSLILSDWQVQRENYKTKPGEDVVFRSGTDPCQAPGRGEFSDEDLTANTMRAWERIRQQALEKGLEITEDVDAGFFRIPSLNTIVWKPRDGAMLFPDSPDFVPYMITAAIHPEVVDPSSARSRFTMEYILAMVNKAQVGFAKPVKEWGIGYERYENLIQMAKSTHHAMEKSGLARLEPKKFNRLWDLCKMQKSPSALGIFHRNAGEEAILAGLSKEQAEMQELFARSFVMAREELNQQMRELQKRMEANKHRHGNSRLNESVREDWLALLQEVKDTHVRLDKILTQLNVQAVSREHKKILQRILEPNPKKFARTLLQFDTTIQNWQRCLARFLEAKRMVQSSSYPVFQWSWQVMLRKPIKIEDSSLMTHTWAFCKTEKPGQASPLRLQKTRQSVAADRDFSPRISDVILRRRYMPKPAIRLNYDTRLESL